MLAGVIPCGREKCDLASAQSSLLELCRVLAFWAEPINGLCPWELTRFACGRYFAGASGPVGIVLHEVLNFLFYFHFNFLFYSLEASCLILFNYTAKLRNYFELTKFSKKNFRKKTGKRGIWRNVISWAVCRNFVRGEP